MKKENGRQAPFDSEKQPVRRIRAYAGKNFEYKRPEDADEIYIEEEGRWFEEQGAKCTLQITPRGCIATKGHLHDALEIILVESGTFVAYINDCKYEVGGGDLLFFRPSDVHRIYAGDCEHNSYFVMKIHPSLVFDVSDKKNGAAYVLRFTFVDESAKRVWRARELEGSGVNECVRALARECLEKRPYFDVAVRQHAAFMLLFLLRSESCEADPVRRDAHERTAIEQIYRAITHMNSHYSENISAYMTARAVGMSYSHFSRTFSSITHLGFSEYLNTIRHRRAEEMFLTTDKSVTEISEACGYSSVSYFIMSFKKKNGITPGAYKLKMKALGKDIKK